MQLNSPAPPGHAVATVDEQGASKSLQMVFTLSWSGMLIFILFGLVAAQTSGMDTMRSHQSRKARLKEIAIYVYKLSK